MSSTARLATHASATASRSSSSGSHSAQRIQSFESWSEHFLPAVTPLSSWRLWFIRCTFWASTHRSASFIPASFCFPSQNSTISLTASGLLTIIICSSSTVAFVPPNSSLSISSMTFIDYFCPLPLLKTFAWVSKPICWLSVALFIFVLLHLLNEQPRSTLFFFTAKTSFAFSSFSLTLRRTVSSNPWVSSIPIASTLTISSVWRPSFWNPTFPSLIKEP